MGTYKKGDDVLVYTTEWGYSRAKITACSPSTFTFKVVLYTPVGKPVDGVAKTTVPYEAVISYWKPFIEKAPLDGTTLKSGAKTFLYQCWDNWLVKDMTKPLPTLSKKKWEGEPADLLEGYHVEPDGSYLNTKGNWGQTGLPPKTYLTDLAKAAAEREARNQQNHTLLIEWCSKAAPAAKAAGIGISNLQAKSHAREATHSEPARDAKVTMTIDLTTIQHMFDLMGVEVTT